MSITRDSLNIPQDLVDAITKAISLEQINDMQPLARESADAMYIKIAISARKAGLCLPGKKMVLIDIMKHFLKSTSAVLEAQGLESGADDHSWAGVRICRTIAVLAQSVYHKDIPFTPKQKEMIISVLGMGTDNKPLPLREEFVKLIDAFSKPEADSTPIIIEKEGSATFTMLIPNSIYTKKSDEIDLWIKADWGQTRGAVRPRKTRRPPPVTEGEPKARKSVKDKARESVPG